MKALVAHLVIFGRFLGKYPLERWIIWRLWSWALKPGSHLWDKRRHKHKHKYKDVHTSDIRMRSRVGNILVPTSTELDSSGQALLTSHPPFLSTERRSGTVSLWLVGFRRLYLFLFHASSHQWNKRNKDKRKQKKKENVSFSCAYACAYFTSVHTSVFLGLRLCLSHKCEPGFRNGIDLLSISHLACMGRTWHKLRMSTENQEYLIKVPFPGFRHN